MFILDNNWSYPTIQLSELSNVTDVDYPEKFKDLIDGCVAGDRQSQNELYSLLGPKMYAVCLRYAKNRDDAQEILQDGFIRVFGFMHQYKYNGSFEGWVRKIMVNCALQKFRTKAQMHAVVNIDFVDETPFSSSDILAQIGVKELLKLVQQLSPGYRIVFNLYVFEGMKHREIAELLSISEGTSKSNLSDARSFLQKAVQHSLLAAKQNINEG